MTRTYPVGIDGVGGFTFRRRTLRDEVAIGAAQERLLEGLEAVSDGFRRLTYMLACLEVLIVEPPAGFDLMDLDPLDPDTFAKVGDIYGGMRAAEERFRATRQPDAPGAGQAAGENG